MLDSTVSPSRRVDAARLIVFYSGGSFAAIGRFFGPAMATARARVLSALRGVMVPKSKARWGVFRDEVYAAFPTGPYSCEAVRETNTEAAIITTIGGAR